MKFYSTLFYYNSSLRVVQIMATCYKHRCCRRRRRYYVRVVALQFYRHGRTPQQLQGDRLVLFRALVYLSKQFCVDITSRLVPGSRTTPTPFAFSISHQLSLSLTLFVARLPLRVSVWPRSYSNLIGRQAQFRQTGILSFVRACDGTTRRFSQEEGRRSCTGCSKVNV